MQRGIQQRLAIWLGVLLIPLAISSLVALQIVDGRVSAQTETELTNRVEVEVDRVERWVRQLEQNVAALALDNELVELMDDGSEVSGDAPSDNRWAAVLDDMIRHDVLLTAAGVFTRDGVALTGTADLALPDGIRDVLNTSMEQRRPVAGSAFRSTEFDDLFVVSAPIVADDGAVLGALATTFRLAPVVDPLTKQEDFGRTSEASLVQRTPEGDALLISLRRFQRDAAFVTTVPGDDGGAEAASLSATETTVVRGRDYRDVRVIAAVTPVEGTNWGISVKVDHDEAFGLRSTIRLTIAAGSLLTAGIILCLWFVRLRPLGDRLRRTAEAAGHVAGGHYRELLEDETDDEIGAIAGSIDQLADDLRLDIEARIGVEQELLERQTSDALTGLMNRASILDAYAEVVEADIDFLVMFVDLARFSEVNAAYGNAVGDELLMIAASRLRHAVRRGLVGRWGADEFVILLGGGDASASTTLRARVESAMHDPFASSVGEHRIGVHMGVATSQALDDRSRVLEAASSSLAEEKLAAPQQTRSQPDAIRLVESALAEDRVEVFYQPVVSSPEAGIVQLEGAEGLVRIRGNDGQPISPAEYLPGIVNSDLEAAIDERVSSIALTEIAAMQRAGELRDGFRIAVNIGPGSIGRGNVASHLQTVIASSGIAPSSVLVEFPETASQIPADLVGELRALGVSMAIDDVGCQFSNIERMVDLPVDVAKIDRRWTMELLTDDTSAESVLLALTRVCKTLGFAVIAEGVEEEAQLDLLRRLGVDQFQGYLFSRPVPIDEFRSAWCTTAEDHSAPPVR